MRTNLFRNVCFISIWCGLTVSITLWHFAEDRMDRFEAALVDLAEAIPERIIWRPGTGIGTDRRNGDAVKRFQ